MLEETARKPQGTEKGSQGRRERHPGGGRKGWSMPCRGEEELNTLV